MPLTPIETIAKAVEPSVANTRLTSAPFLLNLFARNAMRTKMDTSINWSVDIGGGAATIEPLTADGANTLTDDAVPASLRVGRYRIKHQFPISRVDIEEAALLAPEDLANLFESQVQRGINYIARNLNQLLFTGTGLAANAEIAGLQLVKDAAVVYAGLSPVTYPKWQGIRNTNATARPLTTDLLLAIQQTIQENESYFDLIVTSPSMGTSYTKLFITAAGGFGLTPDEEVNGLSRVELGMGGRYYQGIPIVEDVMCPAGTIYFINSADLNVYSFRFQSSAGGDMAQTAILDPSVTYGLNVHLAELPSNNSAVRKFELYTMPQFRVFNRKSVATLDQLT
jgi:hypothetical protein